MNFKSRIATLKYERKNIMRQRATVFAFALLVAIGAASRSAEAANLTVNCDKKQTIRETLKLLAVVHLQGPHTLSVVGSCRENILIQRVDHLTLIAKNGASITDRSDGSFAIRIGRSSDAERVRSSYRGTTRRTMTIQTNQKLRKLLSKYRASAMS